jgi:hypothetical protein
MIMKTTLPNTFQAIQKHICFLAIAFGCIFSASAQTWGEQSSFITDDINGLAFSKTMNTGFAVAAGGRILKKTNSGKLRYRIRFVCCLFFK